MAHATLRVHAVAVALAVLLVMPVAAAETFDARLPDCKGFECITDALTGGAVQIVSAIGLGLAAIGSALFAGFATLVITPFLAIFGSAFGGIGASLGELGGGFFSGATEAFRSSYKGLADFNTRWAGPFGPVVTSAIVLGVLAMLGFAVILLFDRANDILPGWLERVVDSDDEDDDDDDEDAEKKPGFFARIVGR